MPTVRQRATPKVYIWPDGKARSRIDVSDMVASLSFTKALHQPVGQWQLTLATWQGKQGPAHMGRLADLARQVRPNAVVSMGFEVAGGITIGLVDDVRTSRSLAGPNSGRSLTLVGSDFGKVLSRDSIVHASLTVNSAPLFLQRVKDVVGPDHSLIAALPGVWGPQDRDGVPTFLGASVQDVVDWLLNTAPAMQVPLLASIGGTGRPGEYISTDGTISGWNDGRVWSEAPHTFQGSIWDFVRKILDEDFYEVMVDTEPVLFPFPSEIPRIKMVIRPKPFDEKAQQWLPTSESSGLTWDTLRTAIDGDSDHIVEEHEVLSEELGRSDADVFSYYQVTSEHELIGNPDGLKEGLLYPAVDLAALTRAGLRAYEGRINLIAADLAKKQAGLLDYDREVGDEIVNFRNRLFNWYRLADRCESGQLTVAGRDRFRPGDPVLLPWRWPMAGDKKGVRYYCVSTTHTWNVGQPYTTTLRLMRGHNASVITTAKREIEALGTPLGNPDLVAEAS